MNLFLDTNVPTRRDKNIPSRKWNRKILSILSGNIRGIIYSLRTLDSLQLASAIFSNNYSKIDYFVSSDKKLLNIAKEFFQIKNPEEL